MLIKMLPADKKTLLVELARLLALSDNPLLWDGKTKDELRSDSDLNNLTIQKDALETELLEEIEQHASGFPTAAVFGGLFSISAEKKLIEKLKTYPISIIDAPETRIQAATSVLKNLLEHQTMENITTPKVIIFQLFLVALRDGHISSIEWMLLKEIQFAFKVTDFIFKDLLEHAESLNNEMSKLLALILE
ncbi:hypothetical protein [Pantoea sp.]|uniref:hypothetical protein n=1 Tax=Pantoea sp. TaxID=69393 RepID=UPI0028B20824|nr:hypothetical protein [Pantoea sp.]